MSNKTYSLARNFIYLYARLIIRMDIQRYGDLPLGPKLFVANHPSATDPFIIHLVSPQPMRVLITDSAFAVPIFGLFLRRMKQIPVSSGQGSIAIEEAHRSLQAGGSVTIFPEGTISPQEGGFHPPRTGAARLALSTGVPVIPVGIHLLRERNICIKSRIDGRKTLGYWCLRGPYAVTIGQPMQFEGDTEDHNHVHKVSRTIMERIHLLVQESERRMQARHCSSLPA